MGEVGLNLVNGRGWSKLGRLAMLVLAWLMGDVGTHQRPVLDRFRWLYMGQKAYLKIVENG